MPDTSVPRRLRSIKGTRKTMSLSSSRWCSLLGAGAMCNTPSHISSRRSTPVSLRRANTSGLTSSITALIEVMLHPRACAPRDRRLTRGGWLPRSGTSSAAARKAEGADAGRVAASVLLDVVADVPDRAVVARVDGGLRVVLPAHQALRRFALDQHGLAQRQHPLRIVRETGREALAGEGRDAAERVADPDVAVPVDRRAGHPAEQAVGRQRSLL